MRDGDAGARDQLVPLVYRDLELIARAYAGRPDSSLEPQGLVHELYERLAAGSVDAHDRKHFFAVAALAMRQILVDRARRRGAAKRGGDARHVPLTGLSRERLVLDVIAGDDALRRLDARSPRQARIVERRCLVGFTVREIGDALDLSERTVQTEWRLARAWLTRALEPT